MGQVTNALLLEKGLRAEFMKAFNNGEDPAVIRSIVMDTMSTSNQEKYGWLGQVPQMREWADERQLSGLKDFDYTLPNVNYEATLKVDRNVLEDDQLGAVKIRIRDLALRARTHVMKQFADALNNGTTDLGYDGVSFFNASHVESGSAQSNIVTGTSSAPYTTAEFQADFISARSRMRSFTDDQGEPYNEADDLDLWVVARPELEGVIDEVLTASMLNNTTNTLKGAAKKMISSRLNGSQTQDWYLLSGFGAVKPLIRQQRSGIKFESQEKGERAFMRKEYLYGVEKREGFGYGLWQKAIKINN